MPDTWVVDDEKDAVNGPRTKVNTDRMRRGTASHKTEHGDEVVVLFVR